MTFTALAGRVRHRSLRRCVRGLSAALLAAAVAPALAASPAQARPAGEPGQFIPAAGCLRSAEADRTTGGRDPMTLTPAQARAVAADMRTTRRQRSLLAMRLPDQVVVPVHAHVVIGSHSGDRRVSDRLVRRTVQLLDDGYAGGQGGPLADNAPTRFTFRLVSVDRHRRDRWFHAAPYGAVDATMRHRLHRGGANALNLYFVGGPRGGQTLGWSTFPWGRQAHPRQDGVSVNVQALPGGDLRKYDQGDTVIHETGHWLGLLHTFQGGCPVGPDGTPNPDYVGGDQVADTPAEAEPAWGCPAGADTCPSDPGSDPVHNFMDYSVDTCMWRFTPGQVAWMDQAWAKYRAGVTP